MHDFGEPWIIRHTTYFSDPDAAPDALLNDATEWLQYAYHALQLLAELTHERGTVEAHRLPIMLDGIAAWIDMGMRCAAQAHLRLQWQQAQMEVELPVSPD